MTDPPRPAPPGPPPEGASAERERAAPSEAARQYAAVWGAHARAANFNRLLAGGLLAALLAALLGWWNTARFVPEPMIVRVDAVGRADVVRPDDLYWDDDPADAVTRHFLTRFLVDYAGRQRLTARDDWARALHFLDAPLAREAIAREAAGIADVLAGRAAEQEVRGILLRIYPRPQPPHAAEATYTLSAADGRGGWIERSWTATMEFEFVTVTSPEFALVNPIGLMITHLRLEEASVTGG